MPTKITSSLRKDESSRDFYKGEYVKYILIGEEKERMGIVFEKRIPGRYRHSMAGRYGRICRITGKKSKKTIAPIVYHSHYQP